MHKVHRNNSTEVEDLASAIGDLIVAKINAVLLSTRSGDSKIELCDRQNKMDGGCSSTTVL